VLQYGISYQKYVKEKGIANAGEFLLGGLCNGRFLLLVNPKIKKSREKNIFHGFKNN
jgi:hypothetical protein